MKHARRSTRVVIVVLEVLAIMVVLILEFAIIAALFVAGTIWVLDKLNING